MKIFNLIKINFRKIILTILNLTEDEENKMELEKYR